MNLAQSLLDACERQPELEAFPGIRYGELLPRVAAHRRRARHRAGRARRGRPRQPARDGAPLLGRQWAGAVCVPLSWRLSDEELGYCVDDAGAAVVDPGRRSRCPTGPSTRARSTATTRDLAAPLHLGHDRAAEGRASLARSRPGRRRSARRCSTATGRGDRTLGVMPLYHTMGIHSLLAMHLVGGCYVPQARWDPRRGARADRERADHVALPRSDALPRPARLRAARASTTSRASAHSAMRARR